MNQKFILAIGLALLVGFGASEFLNHHKASPAKMPIAVSVPASPVPPTPSTTVSSPRPQTGAPAKNSEPESSSSASTATPPSPRDPCKLSNAHEAWNYFDKKILSPVLLEKKEFLLTNKNNEFFVVTQKKEFGAHPYVRIASYSWNSETNVQTPEQELNTEKTYKNLSEILVMIDSPTRERIIDINQPNIVELSSSFMPGGRLVVQNGVARLFEITLDDKRKLACPENKSCACVNGP